MRQVSSQHPGRRRSWLPLQAWTPVPGSPGDGNPVPEGWRWFPICPPSPAQQRRAMPAVPPRSASPFGREVAADGHRQHRQPLRGHAGSAGQTPPAPGQDGGTCSPRASVLPIPTAGSEPHPIPHPPHPGSALPQVELFSGQPLSRKQMAATRKL